ncbi:hypothetical protein C7974DRAFT_418002 [Boeremia exigua]|uniref:uncharacterized protein n=1 Tax=Boeremia exigua TaxID=749465 RepID=UPI001E8DD2C9|nr:uncharacterized protein C7974DRAFT_418002 [Boeremia exigua]KAH6614282.1 hypothetical protein C7974DRAFT_418002 [Boeremia exigua]
MECSDSPLLDTLKQHAQEEFPDAFEAVRHTDLYNFSTLDIEGEERDVLFIGIVCPTAGVSINTFKPLYAHTRGGSIQYYFLQSEELPLVRFDLDLFPHTGRTRYRHDNLDPFKYIAPTANKAGSEKGRLEDRKAKTVGVAFLVRFAFLLTGRTNNIADEGQTELVRQLEKVCATIRRNKAKEEIEAQSMIEVEDDRVETSTPSQRDQPSVPCSPKTRARPNRTIHTRESASKAEYRGPTKRARREEDTQPPSEKVGLSWFNDSDPPELVEKLETQTQDVMDTIFSVCKARAENEVARDLRALKAEIEGLKAELVESRHCTKEMMDKNDELEAKNREDIEQLEAQLVKEKIKTLNETDKYNEQRKEYRNLQEKYKAIETVRKADNRT